MNKETLIIGLIVLFLLTNPVQIQNTGTGPRGIRNMNPGNIKITSIPWQGKISLDDNTDGVFEQFESMYYGIRASLKLLTNYMDAYGLRTIRKIINRWAPPSENDTGEYVEFVSSYTGMGPDQLLSKNDIPTISRAMFRVENGGEYINNYEIMEAWNTLV